VSYKGFCIVFDQSHEIVNPFVAWVIIQGWHIYIYFLGVLRPLQVNKYNVNSVTHSQLHVNLFLNKVEPTIKVLNAFWNDLSF